MAIKLVASDLDGTIISENNFFIIFLLSHITVSWFNLLLYNFVVEKDSTVCWVYFGQLFFNSNGILYVITLLFLSVAFISK